MDSHSWCSQGYRCLLESHLCKSQNATQGVCRHCQKIVSVSDSQQILFPSSWEERDYELSKSFSLRHHFPKAFFQLVHCGECEIEIPEWLFDLDYPGHYMRRIKNVTPTLPCVVGPHQGVHCRLTLLSSQTRVSSQVVDPTQGCCLEENGTGYTCLPDDPRIVNQYAATDAIATSSGQNDSGMFEIRFNDERYLPFEFHGAVSRWRIELPKGNNHFDTTTLSDAVLQMNFIAREGGERLAHVASKESRKKIPNDGAVLVDIKRDFPDVWHRFINGCNDDHQIEIELSASLFPYAFRSNDIEVSGLEIFVDSGEKSLNWIVDSKSGDSCNSNDKRNDCSGSVLNCVAGFNQCELLFGSMSDQHWQVSTDSADDPVLILKLEKDRVNKCEGSSSALCNSVLVLLHYSLGNESRDKRKEECC